ncbi:hypothetical protein F2Q69_00031321 [Brassica cretica]|uniref:Ubiquitin-like protease family profile domain-containing protein n=1 Tax=Brassica cretica TaxID=69181 RepID=A0A8S9RX84_BRACR|nr:hypothetical protein F2Q69_00031321 [Brassica cretica]
MFPKWEFDAEDTPAENIIKLMFVKTPWKWTMDCWEVTGTWVNTKPAVVSPAKKKVVKEDSPRPRKKAREEAPAEASEEVHTVARSEVTTTVGKLTKEDIKTMFKDIVDAMREGFGTCLTEIKYLSERVEAVEKKVGITTKQKGTSSQNTTSPPKPMLEPGVQMCPQMLVPRKIKLQNQALFYWTKINPLFWIDKKKFKELADWLKTCPHYRTPLDKKPRTSRTWWERYDANPQHFRSERMCFLDHLFAQQWRFNYKDFKDSEPDLNGLGRRLPGGAWNYYAGTIPSFYQSNKVWGMDIDDVYPPVNYTDSHWIAMLISIPKRHIVVWDSIYSSISPEELDMVMEHFLYMVPYLLVECASSDEQRAQYCLEPFTYERQTNIPQARAGDCGVYALKYIECHALGMSFSKKDFVKPNGKTMRDKMAVDIFKELPDSREFENKDNDANLGAYEG